MRNNGEIIGAFQLTFLFSKISHCTKDTFSCSSQLGYFAVVNDEFIELIFQHALYQSYFHGAHIFITNNVLQSKTSFSSVCSAFNLVDSNSDINYHLFNTNFNTLLPCEIGLCFW